MPTVRKIDPPLPVRRRVYARTFLERYPVLEPPPLAVLDSAILAAPESLVTVAPGAIVTTGGRGFRAVVLAAAPGACELYLPGGVELRVEPGFLLPIGRLPRISRVTNRTKGDAWLAKFYQGDRETSRHFAVRRYGGVLGALCAAVAATAETWPNA